MYIYFSKLNGYTPESKLNGSQRPEYTTNHTSKNVKLTKLSYNDIDLTDGWLTWPYRATQMNVIHKSFILEISYIFSYIFKYKLHNEDTCT